MDLHFRAAEKKYIFWLAPWVGTIVIAILGGYMSMASMPMMQGAPYLIIVSALALLLAAKNRKITFDLSREFFGLLILTATILVFNILPLVFRVGFPTTISPGNLDPLAYISSGEFLIKHGVFGNTFDYPLHPFLKGSGAIIRYRFRWGRAVILSFFSQLLHSGAYRYYSVLITIYFALTYPLVYIFARKLFPSDKVSWPPMAFLIGLTLCSITTLYPEGFLLSYIPLVGFAVLHLIMKRNYWEVVRLFKITVLTVLLNPVTFVTMVRWATGLAGRAAVDTGPIGWEPIRFALPFEALGFYNLYYSRDLPLILDLLLGGVVVYLVVFALTKIKQKLLLVNYLVLFGAFYIYFHFVNSNFFVYHRAITYSIFIYSALFAVGLSILINRLSKKIMLAVFLSLMILSFRSTYRTIFQFYHHMRIVDRSLISLSELNNNNPIKTPLITSDVYSPNYDVWTRLWREYFLKDIKLVTISNLNSVEKSVNKNTPILLEKDQSQSYTPAFLMTGIIWENQYYKLGHICLEEECLVESQENLSTLDFANAPYQDSLLTEGWSIREANHRWVASDEARLKLVSKTVPRVITFHASTYKEPQNIKVYVNDYYVGNKAIVSKLEQYTLPLLGVCQYGVNNIRMVFSKGYSPAQLSDSLDTRVLYANFLSISLE